MRYISISERYESSLIDALNHQTEHWLKNKKHLTIINVVYNGNKYVAFCELKGLYET
jgi:hypothetical protein